jgi:hypothetical protein
MYTQPNYVRDLRKIGFFNYVGICNSFSLHTCFVDIFRFAPKIPANTKMVIQIETIVPVTKSA